MTKPGRIPCEVLGCRRTAPAEKHAPGTRICCGKCWRLGTRDDRQIYAAARKLLAPYDDLDAEAQADLPLETQQQLASAEWRAHWAWDRIVKTASEARAGIV